MSAMSLLQYLDTLREIRAYLDLNEVADHMFYGPTNDRYWSESLRVVAINMEPYGYYGRVDVDRDELVSWLYDYGDTNTRTTRYTLTLLAVILAHVEQRADPSPELCRSIYRNEIELERTLDRTVYFNIRPNANTVKSQNFSAIATTGRTELGRLIWKSIVALDPHVVLVAGHAGLFAINGLAAFSEPLAFKHSQLHQIGFLVQSIGHPSRPRYSEFGSVARNVAQWCTRRKVGGTG